MNIEDTIYTDSLPVNSFPVLERIKELLREHKTNNIGDLSLCMALQECMWLLNHQLYGFNIESHKIWLGLRKVREELNLLQVRPEITQIMILDVGKDEQD